MGKGFYRCLCNFALSLTWLVASGTVIAAGLNDTANSSFTNLAERLLRSQYNLSPARLTVSPTNQYTPAVHRLLQVAANLCDAGARGGDAPDHPEFPSIFRPIFAQDGAGVSIRGYTNDNATATATFDRVKPTDFDSLLIDSNSPQVHVLVEGIWRTQASRAPQYFHEAGDILATPELSTASPWLDFTSLEGNWFSLSDEAIEKIPEQLLPLLRRDPLLCLRRTNGWLQAQAVVFAGYWYALEVSSDLCHWTVFANRYAYSETLDFLELPATGESHGFYRVRLLEGPPNNQP